MGDVYARLRTAWIWHDWVSLTIFPSVDKAAEGKECKDLESTIDFKKRKMDNRLKELRGKERSWAIL